MIRHIVLHPPQLLEEQVDVGCVDIYIHKFSQCDLFQLKVLAKETSILKDSVDKRDIFLTNQYPCEGRIIVIKTSILKDSDMHCL